MRDNLNIEESDKLNGSQHPRFAKILVGHKSAMNTLQKSYQSGSLHHAWILTGPKGVGKATLAWKFINELSKLDNRSNNPIEIHSKETATTPLSLLSNLFLCRRPYDEKLKRFKKFITIDEVRKLKEFFNLSAPEKTWRIGLIDCADDLNLSAANALLKLLEEPPSKCILFLIANQPSKVLKTVRSRCRQLVLKKLSRIELEKVLLNTNYQLNEMSETERSILYIIADGCPGKAIEALNLNGVGLFNKIIDTLKDFPDLSRTKILEVAAHSVKNPQQFRYIVSLFLLILYRLGLISRDISYIQPLESEIFLIKSIFKHNDLSIHLSVLHSELSELFARCDKLNLDTASHILNAFLILEKKLKETNE